MLLTNRFIQALIISQWVTDNLFRYRLLIFWNAVSHRFALESSRKHTLRWWSINFVLIRFFCISCLILFFLQTVFNHEAASTVEVLSAFAQLVISVMITCTDTAYLNRAPEFVSFLNKAPIFVEALSVKYANKVRPQTIDFMEVMTLCLVPAFTIIPIFLPQFGFNMTSHFLYFAAFFLHLVL